MFICKEYQSAHTQNFYSESLSSVVQSLTGNSHNVLKWMATIVRLPLIMESPI